MLNTDLQDLLTKLTVSLVIGLVIGAEREYRNKSAGLRTIMLICLGSTIFTIISVNNSHETEVGRIASNIVTGIGFLGAGAIMRYGLTVSGLTTASTIWVAASLGMAVGYGDYFLAGLATVITLTVLILFNYFQRTLDALHKTLTLHVVFHAEENGIKKVEEKMQKLNIRFERKKEARKQGDVIYAYELAATRAKVEALIEYLISLKDKVKSFEY